MHQGTSNFVVTETQALSLSHIREDKLAQLYHKLLLTGGLINTGNALQTETEHTCLIVTS